jgi:hypothetical protein
MKHRSAVTTVIALALVGTLVSVAMGAARQRPTARRGTVTPPTIEFSYYDGHVDAYIETDISSQTLATQLGINYSPVMATEDPKQYPPQYEFKGTSAAGQLTVFGSEPGESSYTPFWQLAYVRWMQGATPVLVTSDTQVEQLEKHHKVSVKYKPIVTNGPIIGVDVPLP